MINLIKCLILGHVFDWKEYDKRIEKEQRYADGTLIYCTRCKSYKKIKMDNK
ncbi:hypothetical protein UFOVP100_14 [uncultured Caudovirales phage]|uniref:Uncharacterized protein n=1 Tax=uncultured Caudovirales phage TaxID=2100421 RepID=A0A6J5L3M7_9CAUD|nr:hypothetical protein UFOVP100_14 [uncultured Caudovirales phage]